MKRIMFAAFLLAAFVAAAGPAASAAVLNGTYTQNFDSMGTSGTTPPTDWSMWQGEGGANTTWSSSITANGSTLSVHSMVSTSSGLTAITSPVNTNINGYNAATVSGDTSNRVLSTSPTGVTGAAIQLTLTNGTGGALNGMAVGYDIDRYTSAGTANELPGYQLFYSLDSGSTWTNVPALNPTLSGPTGVIVPNTVGTTTVPLTGFSLSSAWNDGATLLLRWVDDNAQQTSPDQILGLDNVAASSVPEPATVGVLACAAIIMINQRRRKA